METNVKKKHYICTGCNKYEELFDLGEKTPNGCPNCGSKSCRIRFLTSTVPQGESCHVDVLMKENFRWSDSLGCSTDKELARLKKLHPDSVWRQRPSGGYQMGIKNRHEKLRRMNEAGMQELD